MVVSRCEVRWRTRSLASVSVVLAQMLTMLWAGVQVAFQGSPGRHCHPFTFSVCMIRCAGRSCDGPQWPRATEALSSRPVWRSRRSASEAAGKQQKKKTRGTPSPSRERERERQLLDHYWRARSCLSSAGWSTPKSKHGTVMLPRKDSWRRRSRLSLRTSASGPGGLPACTSWDCLFSLSIMGLRSSA